MSVEPNNQPGGGSSPQSPEGSGNSAGENIQISPPQVERAEGPFEHSGETAGWTEEERTEKEEEGQH